jgi:hypothetical protein
MPETTQARVEGTLDPVLAAQIAKAISTEFYLTRSLFEPVHLDDDDAETALREIILRTANACGEAALKASPQLNEPRGPR